MSTPFRSLPKTEAVQLRFDLLRRGNRKGVIRETELEHDAGFRNFYEKRNTSLRPKLKAEGRAACYRISPVVVVGDSRTGETAKYDGIYYLIQYLSKAPGLLRLVNVGNKDVKLNLVPVDFVVEGIAALAFDDEALGKTIALADPEPLTTEELFDVIAENLAGKRSAFGPPPLLSEISR